MTPTQARQRMTVNLPVELLERLRNMVYWTSGLTLARFVEEALVGSLEKVERQLGGPFPRRMEELKGGRPSTKTSDLPRLEIGGQIIKRAS